jgi:potassium efflux system protein
VGTGFGLQGIVNNFVSGLILLFERPIKVGDWVVVRSGEGYVGNIGARATEIGIKMPFP